MTTIFKEFDEIHDRLLDELEEVEGWLNAGQLLQFSDCVSPLVEKLFNEHYRIVAVIEDSKECSNCRALLLDEDYS